MNIEMVHPDSLVPYKQNPRKVGEEAISALADSIKNYGFRQPIVVDAKNIVVAGHTRLLAAIKLNLKSVPVTRADDLSPEKIRQYRLVDNRLAELTGWDMHKLADEIREIDNSVDIPGFDARELEELRKLDTLHITRDVNGYDIKHASQKESNRFKAREKHEEDIVCPGCGHVFVIQV